MPRLTLTTLTLLTVLCLEQTFLSAETVVVPGTSNIYGAGHATPPAPGGGGAGTLPPQIALPPGTGRTVQFTTVSGTVDYGPCCPSNGPDGIATGSSAPLPLWDGLAGTDFAARGRYFVGVFLDDTEPADPAPPRLVFVDGSFPSLSPGLRQIFFVGDGLTGEGSGAVQVFSVPDTATRLFLGFQDRQQTDLPGWYGDNSGSVSATIVIDNVTGTGDGTPGVTWLGDVEVRPNPFNPRTEIIFTSSADRWVVVDVFDVRGRWVARPFEGATRSTSHRVSWNAAGQASGVYLVRVSGGDTVLSELVTLLK